MIPTLDAALLCSSRVGSDLGCESGLVYGFAQIVSACSIISKKCQVGQCQEVFFQTDRRMVNREAQNKQTNTIMK